jgi:flavodoxin
MKSIIIYESVHHNNTEKIAKVIADEINAELVNVKDFADYHKNLDDYDLVGFGSGIYYSKIHKNIKNFIEAVEHINNQKTFIFTTSGRAKKGFNKKFKELLDSKGFDVVDDFFCKGFDTFGPLKIVGGINKGHPNEKDLANAKNFAKSLLK